MAAPGQWCGTEHPANDFTTKPSKREPEWEERFKARSRWSPARPERQDGE
jgi:hypothetical protein